MSETGTQATYSEVGRLKAGIRKLYDDILMSDERIVVLTRLRELLNGCYDD